MKYLLIFNRNFIRTCPASFQGEDGGATHQLVVQGPDGTQQVIMIQGEGGLDEIQNYLAALNKDGGQVGSMRTILDESHCRIVLCVVEDRRSLSVILVMLTRCH